MEIYSIKPLLAFLAPLVGLVFINLLRKKPNWREGATFAAAFTQCGIVFSMLPDALAGNYHVFTFLEILPDVHIRLRADPMGMIFAMVASTLWIVTTLYGIGYMRGLKEHAQTRFFSFFAVSLGATMGVAFAANLFTLYLFYEMLSLATFPLVTHHQDRDARGGGRTYLTYLLGTSVGLALPAIIYIYAKTGGAVDFLSPEVLGAHIDPMAGGILLLMLVFGFAKSGLMPFHSWLPGAMVAPTPVSALLHAVAVVKVGVFCVIRVYTGVFDQDLLQSVDTGIILTYVAAFTVLISSLIALSQDNLKRRLAFSTIGQLGYITVGVSMLSSGALSGVESPQSMTGSILHIAMHAFGKITLFFCAGAIFVASGRKYISQLDGIGRRMPFTMTAFLIGALSVIGLPPTGGVISKWYLIMGALEAKYVFVMVILLTSSFLNIVYLLPIAVRAFFIPKNEGAFHGSVKEAPWQCVVPLCVTAVLSVLLFFFSGPLVELATSATDYLKPR